MQVLFSVAFISSSGSQILGAPIVHINEGGDKLVLSTTKSNFSLSNLPALVIDTSISSPLPSPPPHFYCFPPFHLQIVDTISTLHGNHIDFTWTKHRPHIDSTSPKHRPFMDPTSSLHRPHNRSVEKQKGRRESEKLLFVVKKILYFSFAPHLRTKNQ